MMKALPLSVRFGQTVLRKPSAFRDDSPSADDPLPAIVVLDAAGHKHARSTILTEVQSETRDDQ
jgi:hypothetical protein